MASRIMASRIMASRIMATRTQEPATCAAVGNVVAEGTIQRHVKSRLGVMQTQINMSSQYTHTVIVISCCFFHQVDLSSIPLHPLSFFHRTQVVSIPHLLSLLK